MLFSHVRLVVTQLFNALEFTENILSADLELLSTAAYAGGIRIVRHVVVPEAFN